MTFGTLISLRHNVDRVISTRAADERAALEARLAKLAGYFAGESAKVAQSVNS